MDSTTGYMCKIYLGFHATVMAKWPYRNESSLRLDSDMNDHISTFSLNFLTVLVEIGQACAFRSQIQNSARGCQIIGVHLRQRAGVIFRSRGSAKISKHGNQTT
jgi:hypothetical protein